MLPKLREAGKTIAAHLILDATLTLGINDRVDLAAVRKLAQRRIHERHARNGVTIVDPGLDPDRRRRRRSAATRSIEPSSFLRGATSIGEDCAIGPLHDAHRLRRSATA